KKHKSRRKHSKETEVSQDEPPTEEHIPTSSHGPLPSEQTKTNQAAEFKKLKKRVKKLNGKKKKRTHELKRLYKVGLSARIVSSGEEVIAAEKEFSIADPVTTPSEVFTGAEDVEVAIAATITQISKDELTLAQILMEIKAAKPKVKGVTIQEPSELEQHHLHNNHNLYRLKIKSKSFKEVQQAFNKTIDWVNNFVAMDSKSVNDRAVESSKRAGKELEQESAKKQKLDEQVQAIVVDDDTTKLKRCLEIVPKDDDVTVKATPLSFKSPTIVDYKIYKEGKKSYFKIIRADRNSQNYLTFRMMFKNFNREDLEVLRSIVKERFKKTKQVDDMDNLLFQTLKIMFEHHIKDNLWKYQQRAVKVHNWKLFNSCGVYCVTTKNMVYYLLVEKMYPFTKNILHQLWKDVRL
nr:hypothetical protein [Tanacetum cinerariifolium]